MKEKHVFHLIAALIPAESVQTYSVSLASFEGSLQRLCFLSPALLKRRSRGFLTSRVNHSSSLQCWLLYNPPPQASHDSHFINPTRVILHTFTKKLILHNASTLHNWFEMYCTVCCFSSFSSVIILLIEELEIWEGVYMILPSTASPCGMSIWAGLLYHTASFCQWTGSQLI